MLDDHYVVDTVESVHFGNYLAVKTALVYGIRTAKRKACTCLRARKS
jgi:hypothetical protein